MAMPALTFGYCRSRNP